MNLKPFWRYYGGKWRAAPHYPVPLHDTIIEPFAGAAGYSTRYFERKVILVEKYPVVAGIWRYLIGVSAAEILRIPEVSSILDLPAWVPDEARNLVGFWLNAATTSPCTSLSSGRKKMAALGRKFEGWTPAVRERVAAQVEQIKHWRIIEGDWEDAPCDQKATWFVDPPYNNRAGSYYVHADVDYDRLARGCRIFPGQVIVCENEGATWLPFRSFKTLHSVMKRPGSREVIWERAA